MRISFLGAADSVTGSRRLVEAGDARVLLECGLFQGLKTLRERSWAPLAVALSHAHLDHSGWLPRLVREGFRGLVYASPATRDLAEVPLLDSPHLQQVDARRANRGGWSRYAPALPLYTAADAPGAIARIEALPAGRSVRVGAAEISMSPAGHLLGAMALTLRAGGSTLVFSGDLGRHDDLLMPPPQTLAQADVQARLGQIIRATIRRGGGVLLPSFAIGRAQALLLVLQRQKAADEIPRNLPIYLDSPMATTATAVYQRQAKLLRISKQEAADLCAGVTLVGKPAESQRLTRSRWPSVIISASGMATGGCGAHLVAGAREVKIHGEYVAVKAEVSHLKGFSGHADADGLMAWLRGFYTAPRHCFVVHGEPDAADTLRLRIKDELGWSVSVPEYRASVDV